MCFRLLARNKITKKDDTLCYFDDERQFDFMLDSVDRNIYLDAMILEGQVCRKYIEFKDYTPYFEKVKTLGRRLN